MTKPVTRYCSFCGASQNEVERLLAGFWPSFICDQCVVTATEQLAKLRADDAEIKTAVAQLTRDIARCEARKPEPIHG